MPDSEPTHDGDRFDLPRHGLAIADLDRFEDPPPEPDPEP